MFYTFKLLGGSYSPVSTDLDGKTNAVVVTFNGTTRHTKTLAGAISSIRQRFKILEKSTPPPSCTPSEKSNYDSRHSPSSSSPPSSPC
jgi:hypothetical protein